MFDPRYPDTSNSLNRVVVADLPGLDVPDDVKGQTGYELVSSFALDKLIDTQLQISRDDFYLMLKQDSSNAIDIAKTMGRNLGYLLLTMIRGDEVNRKARPEWSDEHWALWGEMQKIYLGGGLVTGKMGEIMSQQAQTMLRERAGREGFVVEVASRPQHLPLLGAARFMRTGDKGYVFDFGGTYVKRGQVEFAEDGLEQVAIIDLIQHGYTEGQPPAEIRDRIVSNIVDTVDDFDTSIIPVSIAGYVDATGQPILAQGGIYMTLAKLRDDVPAMLSEVVSQRTGKRVEIKLLHDGSAAASFYAPEDNTAVIMIGTAMGSGYCVPRPDLRPVSPSLSIIDGRGE